jgi:hypothetical protein
MSRRSTREILLEILSEHRLIGRRCLSCECDHSLEFMTEYDHAEHVADEIERELVVDLW